MTHIPPGSTFGQLSDFNAAGMPVQTGEIERIFAVAYKGERVPQTSTLGKEFLFEPTPATAPEISRLIYFEDAARPVSSLTILFSQTSCIKVSDINSSFDTTLSPSSASVQDRDDQGLAATRAAEGGHAQSLIRSGQTLRIDLPWLTSQQCVRALKLWY
jgi:hypothetical protein